VGVEGEVANVWVKGTWQRHDEGVEEGGGAEDAELSGYALDEDKGRRTALVRASRSVLVRLLVRLLLAIEAHPTRACR